MQKITLGVNIDHVAVLREARRVNDPDILQALYVATQNGADQITIHLREDRRHIQDSDAKNIIQHSSIPVNLECSVNEEIIDIVCKLKPHRATLVPEKREEVTTEGGLDLFHTQNLQTAIKKLQEASIPVSLFVDPTTEAMDEAKLLGAEMVELHTGSFANLYAMLHSSLPYSNHSVKELELPRKELQEKLQHALDKITHSAKYAHNELGLEVAAGHGLNYHNVHDMVKIPEITELNIGQSIVARSVFSSLANAVQDMKELIKR